MSGNNDFFHTLQQSSPLTGKQRDPILYIHCERYNMYRLKHTGMLAPRLSIWFLVSCLILSYAPLYAEWVALEAQYQSHPLHTVYVDPDTIHRDGNSVQLSALIDWKAMQGGRSPTRFYSTTLTKQFDCAEKRARTLGATDFYGHMGTGEMIGGGGHASAGHWAGVEPGTLNQGLWKTACGKGN
jgi:hypothetical protein